MGPWACVALLFLSLLQPGMIPTRQAIPRELLMNVHDDSPSTTAPAQAADVSTTQQASTDPYACPGWYRGELHAHSFWSDGRGFPEEAAIMYRKDGYHFLSLTEHNVFAVDTNHWRKIEAREGTWPPNVSPPAIEQYTNAVGREHVHLQSREDGEYVRLKPFKELQSLYEEPGKFILMPGVELTLKHNELNLHLNYLNVPATLPSITGRSMIIHTHGPATQSELVRRYADEIRQTARELHVPYQIILNHPMWMYYDVLPRVLIDNPDIRLFDICNGGMEHPAHADIPDNTLEKFWDVVNAHRAIKGHPLMYGTGVGDQHYYDEARKQTNGLSWIMVKASTLTTESLLAAIDKGDFYASNGVTLEEVTFSPSDRTLRVRVLPRDGVTYRIHFITTKREFDEAITEKILPRSSQNPQRTVTVHSPDIGQTVRTIEGIVGEYQLSADDLYVRARIESDAPALISRMKPMHPQFQSAWTQPHTATAAVPAMP